MVVEGSGSKGYTQDIYTNLWSDRGFTEEGTFN